MQIENDQSKFCCNLQYYLEILVNCTKLLTNDTNVPFHYTKLLSLSRESVDYGSDVTSNGQENLEVNKITINYFTARLYITYREIGHPPGILFGR